jgi:hypothetical protein
LNYSDLIKSLKSPVTEEVAGEVIREEIISDSYSEIEDSRVASIIKEYMMSK